MGTVFSSRFGAPGQVGRRSGLLRFLLSGLFFVLFECVFLHSVGVRVRSVVLSSARFLCLPVGLFCNVFVYSLATSVDGFQEGRKLHFGVAPILCGLLACGRNASKQIGEHSCSFLLRCGMPLKCTWERVTLLLCGNRSHLGLARVLLELPR